MKKLEINQMEVVKGGVKLPPPPKYNCTQGVVAVIGAALGAPMPGAAVDKGMHCMDSFLSQWY